MSIFDRQRRSAALLAKLTAAAMIGWSLSSAALADRDHHDHGHHYRGNAHWHGDHRAPYYRPYYRGPYYHDYRRWHDGYWYHGYRGGRFGWWWSSGGFWYPYAQPVYPYPEPYQPPVIWQQRSDGVIDSDDGGADVDADIDANIDTTAPPEQQSTSSAPQIWYYCNSAKKYFPYVSSCPEAWQQVPVTPSDKPADADSVPSDEPGDAPSE